MHLRCFGCNKDKGPFTNDVSQILRIFDPLPLVSILDQSITQPPLQRQNLGNPLPPSPSLLTSFVNGPLPNLFNRPNNNLLRPEIILVPTCTWFCAVCSCCCFKLQSKLAFNIIATTCRYYFLVRLWLRDC